MDIDARELFGDEDEDRPVERYGGYSEDDDDAENRAPEAIEDNGGARLDLGGNLDDLPEGGAGLDETAKGDATAIAEEQKKKRIIRNPQPKLDPNRITGKRGIGILEEVFKDFKPRGKGYEFQDLNSMMKRYEHWAHRLYPKLPCDDVMERINQLGKKQTVKMYMKRYRRNEEGPNTLPNPNQDDPDNPMEEEPDQTARYGDGDEGAAANLNSSAMPNDDEMFEQMVRESQRISNDIQSTSMIRHPDEEDEENELLASMSAEPGPAFSTPRPPAKKLDESVRERIERNRKMAEERRRQKQLQQQQKENQANAERNTEDENETSKKDNGENETSNKENGEKIEENEILEKENETSEKQNGGSEKAMECDDVEKTTEVQTPVKESSQEKDDLTSMKIDEKLQDIRLIEDQKETPRKTNDDEDIQETSDGLLRLEEDTPTKYGETVIDSF